MKIGITSGAVARFGGTHEPESVGEQTFEINVAFWRALMPTAREIVKA